MKLNIIEVLDSLNKAQSVISPKIGMHQQQVACLAYRIAEKLGWSDEAKNRVFIAGLLHDIGALSIKEKLDAFEGDGDNVHIHAYRGAFLVSAFYPQPDIAPILYYHHHHWQDGNVLSGNPDMPMDSQLVYLADRVCTLITNSDGFVLSQIPIIKQYVAMNTGSHFCPEYSEAVLELTSVESVWLDLISSDPISRIDYSYHAYVDITIDQLVNLACVYSYLIDFRSPFTATHSSGVAKTAEKLAKLMHFSSDECKKVLVAGYLHDIGKLTVDACILEKQSALDPNEFDIIKSHTYYTYYLLNGISGLEDITTWAAYHHEKLNGKGYPFHIKGDCMSLCARILAVSDVFAALREKRPYKEPFTKGKILSILKSMADSGAIDSNVVGVLTDNYPVLENVCVQAEISARHAYDQLYEIQG